MPRVSLLRWRIDSYADHFFELWNDTDVRVDQFTF
jgi:hypothetical protein